MRRLLALEPPIHFQRGLVSQVLLARPLIQVPSMTSQLAKQPLVTRCIAALDVDTPDLQKTFKCKQTTITRLALCAIACICTILGIVWIGREGAQSGAVSFLVISFSFIAIATGLLLTGQSDVVIDDRGISRRIFGRTWQTIRWDNVREIRVFLVKTVYEPNGVRAFAFYPQRKPKGGFNLTPSGKLVFREKFEDMPKLIDLMNQYVSKHGLKIESTIKNVKTPVTRL